MRRAGNRKRWAPRASVETSAGRAGDPLHWAQGPWHDCRGTLARWSAAKGQWGRWRRLRAASQRRAELVVQLVGACEPCPRMFADALAHGAPKSLFGRRPQLSEHPPFSHSRVGLRSQQRGGTGWARACIRSCANKAMDGGLRSFHMYAPAFGTAVQMGATNINLTMTGGDT